MWRKIFLLLIMILVTSLGVGLGVIFFTKEKNSRHTDDSDVISANDFLNQDFSNKDHNEEKVEETKPQRTIRSEDIPSGIQTAMNNIRIENQKKLEMEEKREKLVFSSLNNQNISLLASFLDKRIILVKNGTTILSIVFNDTENMNLPIDVRNGFKEKIKITNIYNNADYATFLSSFLKERTEETVLSNYLTTDLGLKSNKKTPIVGDLPYTYEFSHLMYVPELYDMREESYTKTILEYFVKAYENSVKNHEQRLKTLTADEQMLANKKATIPFLLNIQPKGVKFFKDLYFDILKNKSSYKIYEMHIDSNNFGYLYLFKKILYGEENFKNTLALNLKENYGNSLIDRMSVYDNPNYFEVQSFDPLMIKEVYDKNDKMMKEVQKLNKNIINRIIKIKDTNE